MREVTFTLRVLTPLFLSGADQTTAELRVPSIRGLMRYWYRALISGIVGANKQALPLVMDAEAALFGTTDRASSVAIRVSAASDKPKEFTEQISVRVGGKWQATGKGYLFWTMARSGKAERGNLKPARWYFPAGTYFHVTLSVQGTNTARLEQAIAAFWLLTQLGGLGARSRRCAGSLSVQPGEEYQAEFSFEKAANVQQLKLQLEQGIKKAREVVQPLPGKSEQGPSWQTPAPQAEFDRLAKETCRIWILEDEHSWLSPEAVMTALGESLQKYRGGVAIGKRKIFGLPLPPLIFNKRNASPLLLRVVELQERRYVGIAVVFKTMASDIEEKDYQIIEDWIATFPGKLEVVL